MKASSTGFEIDRINEISGLSIIGLNPPVYDFAWFDLWSAPLGLLNFLARLREQGNRVQLLDAMHEGRVRPIGRGRWKVFRAKAPKPTAIEAVPRDYYRFGLPEEQMENRLAQMPRPDLILVTSIMTYWYPGVYEAVGLARRVFPGTPVVVGGIYASLCPHHARGSGADFILPNALAARGKAPAADLYDRPGRVTLATAYGCPRRCRYCASSVLSPRFEPRPLNEIADDLEAQLALGPAEDLAFYDDALLWNKTGRFYPLCDYLEEKHPNLKLHSPNGLAVDELDAQCCLRLKRAGFAAPRLSLEGIDESTRAAGDGKSKVDHYKRAVENLLAAGYQAGEIETYLLAGLPGQKVEAVYRSIEFVKSLGGRPRLCEYSPIPGTGLFEPAAEAAPILRTEPLWHNNSIYAPYLSGAMSPAELQSLKNALKPEAAALTGRF